MSAKALLNEINSMQKFQYWQVANNSDVVGSCKNAKTNATKSKDCIDNGNVAGIVTQSSHPDNIKHDNKTNKMNSNNNEVIIDNDTCICPPTYHDNDDDNNYDGQSVICDLVKIRKMIEKTLASSSGCGRDERYQKLEKRVTELESTIQKLTSMLSELMVTCGSQKAASCATTKPAPVAKPPPKAKSAPAAAEDDDDDVDLFGSDDDEAADELRQKRLDEYAAKKAKKPAAIAKSSVVLDIKPWDDETDMKEMERLVRTVEMDGLVWGASKLVPLAYGIKKLQIVCVIEDEKVSVEELSEKLTEFEDFVQSVDVAAFNKI